MGILGFDGDLREWIIVEASGDAVPLRPVRGLLTLVRDISTEWIKFQKYAEKNL